MKGTLGNFARRAVIEAKYPKINFNQFRNLLIKQQIKGVINNVADKSSKLLEKLQ